MSGIPKKVYGGFLVLVLSGLLSLAQAEPVEYTIDIPGMHASINFKVNHLGYSWLLGRFDKFEGRYIHDPANPANEKVEVIIDTRSVNSNHAERDRHLRGEEFLNVAKHPQAKFVSTRVTNNADGSKTIAGDFTLNGVTRSLEIQSRKIGEGSDPWGGFRSGFEGTTSFKLADFGITRDLGPASTHVYLELHIEGIRK